jgi:hypothetical protein
MKSNGHVTNWRYCWRCGRVIPERNSGEISRGVHNRCQSDSYRDAVPARLRIFRTDDGQTQKAFVQVQTKNEFGEWV